MGPWKSGRTLAAALVCAAVAVCVDAPSALASVHTVCASGCNFTTIQAAVTAASAGDIIDVHAGTYPEAVTVNKSLVLDGPQAGIDARTRTGSEAVVTGTGNSGDTPFDVTASNVTIDGFTVEDATNQNNFGTNILLQAGTSGETIQNDIIENGISGLILGSGSSTIRQNLIQNNNATGPTSGIGIYTDQFDAGGPLSGDAIEDNSFVNDQNAAVLLGSTNAADADSGFTISGNTFTGDGNGTYADDLTGSTIAANAFTNSLGSQLVLGDGVSNVTVSHNFIQGGSSNGVRIINEGSGPPIATGVTLACNSVTGNSTSGLSVDSGAYTGTLNAAYNWWGSSTGPTNSANPGGTGQTIVDPGAVSFTPFLIDGTDSDPSTPGFQCEPGISIADATAKEASPIVFTATLNNPSSSTVTVDYSTADGTAHAGTDYQTTSGSLTFTPGELTQTVSVPTIQDDGTNEPNETFDVDLSSPSGATVARAAAVGTIQDVAAPSASIATPAPGAIYALNQVVDTSFTCSEGNNGPGLVSCVDQDNDPSGAAIDTGTVGSHAITVTASSHSGRAGTATVSYTVAGAPSVSVSSPVSGGRYTVGQRVLAAFSCSEGSSGPGLSSCAGSVGNGAAIATGTARTHTFKATATSRDGQSATRSVTYAVVAPAKIVTTVKPKPHSEGSFIVTAKLLGPGRVDVAITAPKVRGSFVFARAHAIARGAVTVRIVITPSAKGRHLVTHHHGRVTLRLTITFTPKGGRSRTVGGYVLHLPKR